jgi:hypothetical protein
MESIVAEKGKKAVPLMAGHFRKSLLSALVASAGGGAGHE